MTGFLMGYCNIRQKKCNTGVEYNIRRHCLNHIPNKDQHFLSFPFCNDCVVLAFLFTKLYLLIIFATQNLFVKYLLIIKLVY